ncbi:hypothetical protein ACQP2F_15790 [Actinoplanes sp. CA-030573]|uniref:hypothetical protein n=1 Tax=Actinoplanes sp. CA-030573 TaxID=3239898 RepID=UPI003D8AA99E
MTASIAASVVASVVVSSLTIQTSGATFSGFAANAGNTINAGSVGLSNDDAANTALTWSSALPETLFTRCVTVTYDGNLVLSQPVRLFASSSAGSLPSYVKFRVEEGSGAQDSACTGFTPSAVLFDASTPSPSNGTLAAFVASKSSYSTGLGSWVPTATGQQRSYRFTLELLPDESAQGSTLSIGLTWQSTT